MCRARGMDMNQLLSVYTPIMAPAPSGPKQCRPVGASTLGMHCAQAPADTQGCCRARGMDMNQLLSVYAPIMAPAPSGPEQRRPVGASSWEKGTGAPLLAGSKRPAEAISGAAFKAWQPVACKTEPPGELPLPRPAEQPQDRWAACAAGAACLCRSSQQYLHAAIVHLF